MSQYVNRTEIRVIGMSRSGNHAVIQWITAQAPGRWCFLNATEGRANPFATARPLDGGESHRVSFPGFDLEAEQQGRFTRKDWLVFNHEDAWLRYATHRDYDDNHDAWVGRSERRIDVLVLRDPFNLFASRMRAGERWPFLTPGPNTARIWKQHAREWLAPGRHLRHRPVTISYNQWLHDKSYRRSIADALGLHFTDEGRQSVSDACGGSTFDGRRFNGRAYDMRLLERWTHFIGEQRYRALFDSDMIELSDSIFGPVPGEPHRLFARAPQLSSRRAQSRNGTATRAAPSSALHPRQVIPMTNRPRIRDAVPGNALAAR